MMRERSKFFIPAFIFIAVFFVYVRTLNPVFHADDSPETIACAYTLGIQHPPGYPLPTLTGKIFSFVDAGNIGLRVKLPSAVFGALLCMMVYLIVMDTLRKKDGSAVFAVVSSAVAALALAFSYTLWNPSLSAKGGIYALNGLLLALIIFFLFKWERTKKYNFFYTAVFIYGLSLGNHWESMAVAFPALITFVVLVFIKDNNYKSITLSRFFTALVFGLMGPAIYMYLLIRAQGGAFLNWGDPVDLKQLLWVVTRAEYSATETARNIQVIIKQVLRVAQLVTFEFTLAGLVIFLSGIKGFLKTNRMQRFIMFAVLFLTIVGGLSFYFNLKEDMIWIMDVFIIPVYMTMAVFLGLGINYAYNAGFKNGFWGKAAKTAAILSCALPLYLFASNFNNADQSKYFYSYDYGMNMIKSMDKPGVAMLEGDYAVMPQMYFKYVEKKGNFCPVTTIFLYVPWSVKNLKNECPDVRITVGENASLPDKIRNVVESNYTDKAIYTSVFRKAFEEYYPQGNAALVPYGAVMKLTLDKAAALKEASKKLKMLTYRGLLEDRSYMNITTRLGLSNYSSLYMETGNAYSSLNNNTFAMGYMQRALALSNDRTRAICLTHLGVLYSKTGHNDKALSSYEEAVNINPNMVEAYSNMAGIYNNNKEYDKAVAACEKAIKANPAFSEAYNNMAIAYYSKGMKDKAVEMMEKAVSLSPGNEMAKRNLLILKGVIK